MKAGDKIGNYEIISTIAAGGMGVVYRARHLTFQDERAVKFLLPNLAINEKIRHRFLQEAHVQYQLDHPNIVKVHDLIDENEHLAMVMELVEGPTLEDWLEEKSGPVSFEEMMEIMQPVFEAVSYAHLRGTVHRDLKPANVLLKPRNDGSFEPKITDFGLVKVLEDSTGMTRTGTQMGTIPFMAPEQFIGRTDISPAADVFALGIICWRMLSGSFPTNPRNQLEVAEMYSGRHPIPPLQGDIGKAISKAVLLDPDERLPAAQVFLDHLVAATQVDLLTQAPSPPSPPQEIPQNTRETSVESDTSAITQQSAQQKNPKLLWLLIVSVGAAAWFGLKEGPKPPPPESEKLQIYYATATRDNGSSRNASKLIDNKLSTAWCSPEHQARGSEIQLHFPSGYEVTHIRIWNGYQKVVGDQYEDRFWINGRVQSLASNWDMDRIILRTDTRDYQRFNVKQAHTPLSLELKGSSSYQPGSDFDLACISEIEVWGYWPHPNRAPPIVGK